MSKRNEVLREFGAAELASLLPPVVAEYVNSMADEIVRLREALASAAAGREVTEDSDKNRRIVEWLLVNKPTIWAQASRETFTAALAVERGREG